MRDFLLLEDGATFPGRSVGAPGIAFGEAVFTTSMSGYQEVVTDPSYAGQVVAFTTAMVGNYGVAETRLESERPHARGVVMRRSGGAEWCGWLAAHGVVALDEVDTRTLVLRLRDRGSMRAALVSGEASVDEVGARLADEPVMAGRALAAEVSAAEPYTVGNGRTQIVLLDYGCKRSIVRRLVAAGASVRVLPHTATVAEVLAARPDGVLLSNGPGDPAALPGEAETVGGLLGLVPILGICLGHQLLATAAGLETFKLPFGHRGANHPVLELASGRVLVTSQNHGFAVRGSGEAVSHVSLYDGTVEGVDLPAERARSVQFHPEASPGPHDACGLIEEWVGEVRFAEAA